MSTVTSNQTSKAMSKQTARDGKRSKRRLAALAVVTASTVAAAGCGGVRGELVETGFTDIDGDGLLELAFIEEIEFNNPFSDYDVVEVDATTPNPELFDFSATDVATGEPVMGTELVADADQGEGAMVIGFFTPSCPVCVDEGPKFTTSAELNPDVTYVMVHSGGDIEQYQGFIDEYDLDLPNIHHITDGETKLWIHFGILGQPSYVLMAPDGSATRSVGALQDHGLLRAVELLRSGTAKA